MLGILLLMFSLLLVFLTVYGQSHPVEKKGKRSLLYYIYPENENVPVKINSEIKPLFVGDSRTLGMSLVVDSVECIAENGATYYFLKDNDENIRSTDLDCVVIGFGVNDFIDIEDYIEYANNLGNDLKIPVFFLTVNPVEEPKASSKGYKMKNNQIEEFNKLLRNNAENYTVINTYEYLVENGFSTVDGLHYNDETYEKIYRYVISEISRKMI